MDQTAVAVRARGHDVEVSNDPHHPLDNFDVIHGTKLDEEQLARVRHAEVPLVISTIWWPLAYVTGGMRSVSLVSAYRAVHRNSAARWWAIRGRPEKNPGYIDREVCGLARALLPNGPSEAAAVRRDLRVGTPMQSVPNGVDASIFTPADLPRDSFVLCVGRVEPHKNQLGTLHALAQSARPVIIAGPPHPHHQDYFDACRNALRPQDRMLGRVSLADLLTLHRTAAVHVLNSWFETTGLVSLEAAACGTPVVTTRRGFARDYFGDFVGYCDPARPSSVMRAIDSVVDRPTDELREHVAGRFSWARAAEKTELGYLVAIGARPASTLSDSL
jgi:glycosyltransferase involved in cell wall biosynthesis